MNRRANNNGPARILGGVPLRDWFQKHFEPTETVAVDFHPKNYRKGGTDTIKLYDTRSGECARTLVASGAGWMVLTNSRIAGNAGELLQTSDEFDLARFVITRRIQ